MADERMSSEDVHSTVWVHWRSGAAAPGGRAEDGLVCLLDGPSHLALWDPVRGSFLGFSAVGGPVTAAAFSRDGTRLYMGDASGTVRALTTEGDEDRDAGDRAGILRAGDSGITALAPSGDGTWLCVGTEDGLVSVWTVEGGSPEVIWTADAGSVTAVAFSADGSVLTGSDDGIVRLWSRGDPEPTETWTCSENSITALAVSSDGAQVAFGSGDDGSLWVGASFGGAFERVVTLEAGISSLSYSPAGDKVATGNAEGLLWIAERRQTTGSWVPHIGKYLVGPLTEESLPPPIFKFNLPPSASSEQHGWGRSSRDDAAVEATRQHAAPTAVDLSFASGFIVYNPPSEMRVAVEELVEVRVTGQEELVTRLREGLRGRGIPQLESIEVSEVMSVTLAGKSFDIKGLSQSRQFLRKDDVTRWDFSVTPRRAGEHELELRAAVVVGEVNHELPVMLRRILVTVNRHHTVTTFMRSNWATIVGLVIALVGAVAGVLALWK